MSRELYYITEIFNRHIMNLLKQTPKQNYHGLSQLFLFLFTLYAITCSQQQGADYFIFIYFWMLLSKTTYSEFNIHILRMKSLKLFE